LEILFEQRLEPVDDSPPVEIDGEAVATVDGVEVLLRCDPAAVVDAPR